MTQCSTHVNEISINLYVIAILSHTLFFNFIGSHHLKQMTNIWSDQIHFEQFWYDLCHRKYQNLVFILGSFKVHHNYKVGSDGSNYLKRMRNKCHTAEHRWIYDWFNYIRWTKESNQTRIGHMRLWGSEFVFVEIIAPTIFELQCEGIKSNHILKDIKYKMINTDWMISESLQQLTMSCTIRKVFLPWN